MDIYIKNADSVQNKYAGMWIQPSSYHLIDRIEIGRWQNDSALLSDIGSGKAVVARSDSGNDDIDDVADAISFLKDTPIINDDGLPIVAPSFEETLGLTTTWKGHLYTATAGALSVFDEVVTSQIRIRGGWYELLDANAVVNDYMEFSLIDKDDILGLFGTYGLTVGEDILELKKFVRTEYVNPLLAGRRDFESQAATVVVPGLYLRTSYNSTGATDVKFKMMEKYHEI